MQQQVVEEEVRRSEVLLIRASDSDADRFDTDNINSRNRPTRENPVGMTVHRNRSMGNVSNTTNED